MTFYELLVLVLLPPLLLLLGIAITLWMQPGSQLEVGRLFTPLVPDPKSFPPADSKPAEAKPITPEQRAEASERRNARETRLLDLIHQTQSKTDK